jgi:MFS family permease
MSKRSSRISLPRSAVRPGGLALPFFYGWVLVAVAFVTMAIGVNARTAFSLLFSPILDEFGWSRGTTAGAFSFGFLVSAVVTPGVGWLMDRRGPRLVIEIGVGLMGVGLASGDAHPRTVAALSHPRRAGRRRRQLPRLYRPVTLPDQLIRTAARAGA